MTRCRTDCIEKPLRIGFKRLGHFVGSHPLWFLITPLILSAGLGGGFYFLDDRISNNIQEEFTPSNGQAKAERKYIQETFPGNDSMFSSLRLSTDGNYATLIATRHDDILTVESLQEILNLDSKVRHLSVSFGSESFTYKNVCAEAMGRCSSNGILDIIKYNASNIDNVTLTYPWFYSKFASIPLFLNLGNVTLNNTLVESAGAIQLHYYLREDQKERTDLWLQNFINMFSNTSLAASLSSIQVSYSTSMSMQWEFEKSPDSVIMLFSITYTIVITFAIISSWRMDNVRTKVWVATCGVLSTGLAILSGFGALLLLDQPFVMTVASCPFLILGIGLDDMFIMISCWQRTRVLDSVPERLAATYEEAAISILITTLTDALALFLGYSSPFGSVKAFCLYAGLCICFCYVYSITFLGACMALNGQREGENKHWLTCARIPQELPTKKSKVVRLCCIGGSYDSNTEKEEEDPISQFFWQYYGPFLTHKFTKACVFLIYVGYLAVSIYGCYILEEGLDTRNLALDDSYIIDYYSDQRENFNVYSFNVMVAVKEPISYWEPNNLDTCVSKFKSLPYINGTTAWFLSFQHFAEEKNLTIATEDTFNQHLPNFLALNPMFKQDINFTASGKIQASRYFVQTLNNMSVEDMMTGLRKTAEECPEPLLVYNPAFIYLDQYTVVVENTIQTMLVAVIVMLIISLILIPSPACSVWVVYAICSVIVGVTGFMSLWDVNLDSISMINLVMCIGFSVDFSAHISYCFVSSHKSDVNEKATNALASLGYAVLQGGISTILGVVVLAMSGSYIFRTFFKIVFLVITFGMLHGLVFIPVFLTFLGACAKQCSKGEVRAD